MDEIEIALTDEAAFLQFAAANPDEIENCGGTAEALSILLQGGTLSFGGGAAPIFRVTLAGAEG